MKHVVQSSGPLKFVSSSSASTGQNAILGKGTATASLVNKKFGKPKEERKSPSIERGKGREVSVEPAAKADTADGEWTIEGHARLMGLGALVPAVPAAQPGDATQGCTQADSNADELMELERKADDDKKRHRAVIDGGVKADKDEDEDEKTVQSWKKELEVEKEKRRDLADSLDDLKREVGYQREAAARASHTLGKVVNAGLQQAERNDQVTVFVIKKKQERAKAFFDAYKQLQALVVKDAALVSVTNNGPMLSVMVAGPEHVRDSINTLREWQRKAGIEAAIFRGKSTLTQMMELPIRAAYQAMISILKIDSRAARDHGLNTNWLDAEKKWAITHNGSPIIRGKCNISELESEVHLSMEHLEESGATDIIAKMKSFEASDRFGALFEMSYSRVERFAGGEPWGRQPRGGGGKGKGS
jgi:hypothetical protein